MILRLGLIPVLLLLPSKVLATDLGPLKNVKDVFNKEAKLLGFSGLRMVLRECVGEPETRCMYSIPGKVSVLASTDDSNSDKTQLIAFAADRSSDIKQFVSAASVAMSAFSPDKDQDEIRAAFKVLFTAPLKEVKQIQIGGVQYVLKPIEGGIFFTVKDADLKSD